MQRPLRAAVLRLEGMLDAAFGQRGNPVRSLGGLGFLLFWIVAGSGMYLYAAFDTSAVGAHASVERMSANAWPAGSLVRSVHRYASDAFAVVALAHLAREWLFGHARGFRWYSWVTGVALLWLVYASGLGGYWLVWDRLAQFSIVATMEWLDALPLFGEPLARNFIAGAQVSDRLFSLLIFLHIGIPLALLAGMWVHIQRIARARVLPPRAVTTGIGAALCAVALAWPARSLAPADLGAVDASLPLDWYYHVPHVLAYATSAPTVWWLLLGATVVLALLPWLPPAPRPAAARVDPANCNGCGRCQQDCPYLAVTLQPRADARAHAFVAVVEPALCAACGICAGACPSGTPFRTGPALLTGIDMPQRTLDAVRHEVEHALDALPRGQATIVFACQCAADARALADATTAVVPLLCAGMLPPSFVEYALRSGASAVLISACRQGDCAYRLGDRWTQERLARERAPRLRQAVDARRIATAWASPTDRRALARALLELRTRVAALPPAHEPRPKRQETLHG